MLSASRTLGIVVAAIALSGGGFAAGRLTAPDSSSTASQCSEPRKLYRKYADAITPEQDVAEKRINGRMLANAILQNPNCFSSTDRASAQTILDAIDQGVQQESINDLEECVDSATDGTFGNSC